MSINLIGKKRFIKMNPTAVFAAVGFMFKLCLIVASVYGVAWVAVNKSFDVAFEYFNKPCPCFV